MLVKMILAKDYTIQDLLTNFVRISIPVYQRNYSWNFFNVSTMINDLVNNSETFYFLGNIIINNENDSEIKVEIIDGQQRVISIFLLLIALTRNELLKDKVKKLIFLGEEIKLNIEPRINDEAINLVNANYKNLITDNLKKYHEVSVFEELHEFLETKDDVFQDNLLNKILNATIVIIRFTKTTDAHKMFSNLNTKGVPLEPIEIVKSKIFSYLDNDLNYYKNLWGNMLVRVKNSDYNTYLIYYHYLKNDKKVSAPYLNKISTNINSKNDAVAVLENLTNVDKLDCLLEPFLSVAYADKDVYKKYFRNKVSFDSIFGLINFLNQSKFEQLNVSLVAMLALNKSNDKKHLKDNLLYIENYVRILLIFHIYRSLQSVSPSKYGNNFYNLAKDIYHDKSKMKESIKKILENLKINTITKKDFINTIKNMECSQNSKELRFAKILIQTCYEILDSDLVAEHFLPFKSTYNNRLLLGNIIPVKKDDYKKMEPKLKISKYIERKSSEKFIEMFLMDIKKGEFEIQIKSRNEKICNLIWNLLIENLKIFDIKL